MDVIRGKVWKYGDNLDTDEIMPATVLLSTSSPEALASHAMEGIDPGFVEKVRHGDILVAGANTGCGSSREQAPLALKHAGIAAVVADSFARTFFRNCVTIGLPVLQSHGITEVVDEGDTLEIDLESALIHNLETGEVNQAVPLGDFVLSVLDQGGLIPHLKTRPTRQGTQAR